MQCSVRRQVGLIWGSVKVCLKGLAGECYWYLIISKSIKRFIEYEVSERTAAVENESSVCVLLFIIEK